MVPSVEAQFVTNDTLEWSWYSAGTIVAASSRRAVQAAAEARTPAKRRAASDNASSARTKTPKRRTDTSAVSNPARHDPADPSRANSMLSDSARPTRGRQLGAMRRAVARAWDSSSMRHGFGNTAANPCSR